MAHLSLRHELNCTSATCFEKIIFSDEYNRRLFLELLKFPTFKTEAQNTDGDVWTRRARIEPPATGLPGPLKKIIGDKLGYVEEGEWKKGSDTYKFRIIPDTMAEKTRIEGTIRCKDEGDGKCVRLAEIDFEVKVFMVGGMAEERMVTDTRASYDAGAKFINEYLKEKGL